MLRVVAMLDEEDGDGRSLGPAFRVSAWVHFAPAISKYCVISMSAKHRRTSQSQIHVFRLRTGGISTAVHTLRPDRERTYSSCA